MAHHLDGRRKSSPACPVARTAALIGNESVLLIVRDLFEGPRHFCELERSLRGMSTRTLADKLKFLERRGLVRRKLPRPGRRATPHRHAAYALTPKGRGLKKIVDALSTFGKRYL